MASYFIASHPLPDGGHAVHDRSRCPPSCFPQGAAEYLGEFRDCSQAVTVARVRYSHARGCPCCNTAIAASPQRPAQPLSALRS